MRKLYYFLFNVTIFFSSFSIMAQKMDRIKYNANELYEFQENGEKIRRLIGDVVFKQKTSTMYCDSAYYYVKDNLMKAFGHIKIEDDSITIISKNMIYNGQDRTAQLRDDVIYTKGDQRLTTNFFDYNLDTEVGHYVKGGKLKNSKNVLTSEIGFYYELQDYVLFFEDVFLVAPDYTLESDTLRYDITSEIVTTEGNTIIVTQEDETILHADGGVFRTSKEQSNFVEGTLETEEYYVEGDELFFDDLKKYYNAQGHVKLTAKNDNIVITGDQGFFDKSKGISKVYGHALMQRFFKKDTLYMSADTLVYIEKKYDSVQRILAYHHVEIWKPDLQGLADSTVYFLKDSLLYFYTDPIFWYLKNQLESDTVIIEVTEKEIKSMSLLQKAFITSEDTLHNFNQIKGREMKALFKESKIDKIYVNGNGESIYYILDREDPSTIFTLGMNRILCSNMMIQFVDDKLDNMSFYIKPEARFIPPDELTTTDEQLDGFHWQAEKKPTLDDFFSDSLTLKKEEVALPKLPPSQKIDTENKTKNKNEMLKSFKELEK